MSYYGTAICIRQADGTITVERADPIIEVARELWDQATPEHRPDDTTLVLDTAGEYRYRLIGTETYPHPTLIFERITDTTEEEQR